MTDVQRMSGVGRATFYRIFDNITDVLSYLCDDIFEKVGCKYEGTNNFNSKESLLNFIQELMENKALLKAIVDCNRMDILYNAHAKFIGNSVEVFFPNMSFPNEQLNYLLMTMTACVSASLVAWLKNGAYETSEQLYDRLKNCFETLCNIFN